MLAKEFNVLFLCRKVATKFHEKLFFRGVKFFDDGLDI